MHAAATAVATAAGVIDQRHRFFSSSEGRIVPLGIIIIWRAKSTLRTKEMLLT
jgi:hypothetical protein